MRPGWILTNLALIGLAVVDTAAAVTYPLKTSSRWILDATGARVKLRCVNWAGHMETYIPEGLQHQSVDTIAAWIGNNGFNCVRLTYSIDMALSPNLKVSDAFVQAARLAGVQASQTQSLYQSVLQKNSFVSSATVLDVYKTIIQSLAAHNVMTILDNHVSRASWCCGQTDGNGWFAGSTGANSDNTRFFDVKNWTMGLEAMAKTAAAYPSVIGMSLRNEMRPTSGQDTNGHADWYKYVAMGASTIHNANANLLIVIGGVGYATDISFLGSKPLDRSAYPDKVLWEWHNYSWTYGMTVSKNCADLASRFGNAAGYLLTQGKAYTGPLWLSEFGIDQSINADDRAYMGCIVSYMTSNDAEWAYWGLQGDYYIRDKTINKDETFGLLKADWSDWRNPQFKTLLGKMWNVTQGP